MTIPRSIWSLSVACAIARGLAFFYIRSHQSHDAQWQLDYIPLWVADLPITLLYFPMPYFIGEAIIGPIWWFFLPVGVWWLFVGRRRRASNTVTQTAQSKGHGP